MSKHYDKRCSPHLSASVRWSFLSFFSVLLPFSSRVGRVRHPRRFIHMTSPPATPPSDVDRSRVDCATRVDRVEIGVSRRGGSSLLLWHPHPGRSVRARSRGCLRRVIRGNVFAHRRHGRGRRAHILLLCHPRRPVPVGSPSPASAALGRRGGSDVRRRGGGSAWQVARHRHRRALLLRHPRRSVVTSPPSA